MKSVSFNLGLLALALSAPFLHARQRSVGAPSTVMDHCSISGERYEQRFLVADLNNDEKPDRVTLVGLGQHDGLNEFSVRVCDSTGAVSLLSFESSERSIVVTALDVNQDGSPDIVVEERFTQKRIQVWLNDGRGRFHEATVGDHLIPETRAPCTAGAPSKGRHQSPRACLRRGKRLSIQTSQIPIASRYSPVGYHWSFSVRMQKDLDGPNLSRAPPSALHL